MSTETVKTVAWLWWDANATGIDTGGKHGRYKVSDLDPTDIRAFAVVARSDLESAEARAQRAEQALRELVRLKDIQEKYAQLQPSSPRAHNWSQYISDVDNWLARNDSAWAAARAIVDGEKT